MALDSTQLPEPTFYAEGEGNADVYDDGCLRVEHSSYYIACNGKTISLSRKEFLIISRLARSPERTVRSEDIWRYAWGEGTAYNAQSLRVHIHRLRHQLAPFCVRIESMVNVGYRLLRTSPGDSANWNAALTLAFTTLAALL